MKLEFSGINLKKASKESFSLDLSMLQGTNEIRDYKDFYLTFDSIYYVKESMTGSRKCSEIFSFDIESKTFQKFYDGCIISLSNNTNYLFCLVIDDPNEHKLSLVQISQLKILNKISLTIPNLERIDDLMLASTDINVYLFENTNLGLKCLYELNDKNSIDIKRLENEQKLNENSNCSLEVDKIVLKDKISQISCGKEHLLILTINNKVYSFGLGTKGQLGHGKIENNLEPKLIENLTAKISSISAGNGGWHSAAIDEEGNCFIWGWNSHGQLGLTDNENSFISTPIKLNVLNPFTDKPVKFKKISLGARHSAFIDSDSNLFTFGWNKYNQLFHDTATGHIDEIDLTNSDYDIEEPIKVTEFNDKLIDLKCGCWYTLALLRQ